MIKRRSRSLPRRIRRVLEAPRLCQPERICLFGSWVRGEADALSDADIVLIRSTEAPFLERTREVYRLLPPDVGAVGCVGLYSGGV
ncbi:nucleotidyltransferase domain-containing protein [Thermoflexus sp.]|uniref:nucleotidyltransferase domain-containing protein n=1 Tax=Thermoflexus sp. TaxID=1969742 RepID=UPI0035E448C6